MYSQLKSGDGEREVRPAESMQRMSGPQDAGEVTSTIGPGLTGSITSTMGAAFDKNAIRSATQWKVTLTLSNTDKMQTVLLVLPRSFIYV